jgi:hypothetical protein
MFARVHDVFVIINFLFKNWELKHLIVDLFKVIEISGATMALNYELFLIKFSSQKKLHMLKAKGCNL